MKKDHCGSTTAKTDTGCQSTKNLQMVQPFPTSGSLGNNRGVPLPDLKAEIGNTDARAYSYVLSSVKLEQKTTAFEQHGSAPNFQGGTLTLCTCKHQMRATQSADMWKGVWLAGFTSRTIHDGKHWLFYLAKITSAHESHADLWQAMKAQTRKSKAADRHFLGDIFRPKTPSPIGNARFDPSHYVAPSTHTHRQKKGDEGWRNDINYRHSDRYRQPPLLVADPSKTFIWDEPLIYFAGDHCRNFRKWSSLSGLVSFMREAS